MPPRDRSIFTAIASLEKEVDGEIFIPGMFFTPVTGTWTLTRSALGNYFMRKTAADNTAQLMIPLDSCVLFKKIGTDPVLPRQAARASRGIEITAIDLVYMIATAALDAHTYDLAKTTYANNAAPVIDSTIGGTLSGTLAVATQAQPYVTTITIGTPFTIGHNTTLATTWFELEVNAAATSVYDFYGMFLRFNHIIN